MAETTGIEWADASWNPWQGCRKVSPGCKFCYAERDMERYGKDFTAVVRSKTTFDAPLRWLKNGKVKPDARIFTCSFSDFFIEDADKWRDEAWNIIKRTPYTYLILTKRPENIEGRLPDDWGDGYPNVWLLVSAENQEMFNKRWDILEDIPAVIKGVSAEPLLGFINIGTGTHPDWIITGGESGGTSRKMKKEWALFLIDQCEMYKIPVFHKQNGGNKKINGTWGGDTINSETYKQFPKGGNL